MGKTELIPGLQLEKEMYVGEKDTATIYGSGTLEVFATPAMIAFMEYTAMTSVEHLLEESDTTVGTEINVQHLKASPVGAKIRCKSELTEVDGRQLSFEINVWDNEQLIGKGTHKRFIINKERFMAKL